MARTSGSSSQKNARKAATPAQKKARRQQAAQQQAAPDRLLNDRARRDIEGVVCAVAAVALFVIACLPQEGGLLTSLLSQAVHIGLGLGAYLLPIVLALIAASLFTGRIGERISVRVTVGLLILFFAVLLLLALYTPGVTESNLDALFAPQHLTSQGGYIGALCAWVLMLLLGRTVSTVVALGLVVISFIVIGFSISGLVEKVRAMRAERAAQEESLDAAPALPYEPQHRSRGENGEARLPLTQKIPFARSSAETRPVSAASGEPTRRIASKQPTPRKRQASTPLRADAGSTQQLTRKLGDKHAKELQQAKAATRKRAARPAAVGAAPSPTEDFELPSMDLLEVSHDAANKRETEETLRETAALLQETLSDFGVDATVEGWAAGPTVTLFKVALPAGVRVSRVTGLTDDIALAMASQGVRIFSPVPGTNYVGIEVPNINRRTVYLGDVLKSAPKAGPLQIAIGEDVEGHPIVNDLAKMPHLLVAGTTGSGKSVAINGMIMSILMRATPNEVRFIMIDPKRVEFTPYNGIPHLYVPVVTETKEAASALSWAVAEMERRLKVFSKVGARNIAQYNDKVHKGMKIGEDDAKEVPYIVIVIDELADLMMNVGKEVEFSISRLAQLARAAGIHMIIATQRPSTNVVTGLIKANITNRMALTVASGIDSRVILDATGAENLIGNGDMLYSKPEYPKPQRFQGCFTSNKEIEAVVAHLKEQGTPEYHEEILKTNVMGIGDTDPGGNGARGSSGDDPLLWDAAEIVVNSGLGSTSNIQRRLKVGYSRAGRIMDMLEEKGVVGPPNGSKPREVLVDTMELESLKAFEMNDQAGE